MSFDLNSIEKTQSKTYDGTSEFQYKYNHYDTSIYYSQIDTTEGINVPVNVGIEPNVTFIDNGVETKYKNSHFYLTPQIHKVDNLRSGIANYVCGQLIIKHESVTDRSPAYSCYFLANQRSSASEAKVLDKFIEEEPTSYAFSLKLNDIIPSPHNDGEAIYFKSGNQKVFVFTTPIYVTEEMKQRLNQLQEEENTSEIMFNDVYNSDYRIILGEYIRNDTGDEIYIDCNPTGETKDEDDAYVIPVNSDIMDNKSNYDNSLMVTNFAIFAVITVFSYFNIPPLYKYAVIDLVLLGTKIKKEDGTPIPKDVLDISRSNALFAINSKLIIGFLVLNILVISYNIISPLAMMSMLVITILSASLISSRIFSDDITFLSTMLFNGKKGTIDPESILNPNMDEAMNADASLIQGNGVSKTTATIMAIILFLVIMVPGLVVAFLPSIKEKAKNSTGLALIGITAGSLIMYIGALITRSVKLHADASKNIRATNDVTGVNE
jgi:hypothetical protein